MAKKDSCQMKHYSERCRDGNKHFHFRSRSKSRTRPRSRSRSISRSPDRHILHNKHYSRSRSKPRRRSRSMSRSPPRHRISRSELSSTERISLSRKLQEENRKREMVDRLHSRPVEEYVEELVKKEPVKIMKEQAISVKELVKAARQRGKIAKEQFKKMIPLPEVEKKESPPSVKGSIKLPMTVGDIPNTDTDMPVYSEDESEDDDPYSRIHIPQTKKEERFKFETDIGKDITSQLLERGMIEKKKPTLENPGAAEKSFVLEALQCYSPETHSPPTSQRIYESHNIQPKRNQKKRKITKNDPFSTVLTSSEALSRKSECFPTIPDLGFSNIEDEEKFLYGDDSDDKDNKNKFGSGDEEEEDDGDLYGGDSSTLQPEVKPKIKAEVTSRSMVMTNIVESSDWSSSHSNLMMQNTPSKRHRLFTSDSDNNTPEYTRNEDISKPYISPTVHHERKYSASDMMQNTPSKRRFTSDSDNNTPEYTRNEDISKPYISPTVHHERKYSASDMMQNTPSMRQRFTSDSDNNTPEYTRNEDISKPYIRPTVHHERKYSASDMMQNTPSKRQRFTSDSDNNTPEYTRNEDISKPYIRPTVHHERKYNASDMMQNTPSKRQRFTSDSDNNTPEYTRNEDISKPYIRPTVHHERKYNASDMMQNTPSKRQRFTSDSDNNTPEYTRNEDISKPYIRPTVHHERKYNASDMMQNTPSKRQRFTSDSDNNTPEYIRNEDISKPYISPTVHHEMLERKYSASDMIDLQLPEKLWRTVTDSISQFMKRSLSPSIKKVVEKGNKLEYASQFEVKPSLTSRRKDSLEERHPKYENPFSDFERASSKKEKYFHSAMSSHRSKQEESPPRKEPRYKSRHELYEETPERKYKEQTRKMDSLRSEEGTREWEESPRHRSPDRSPWKSPEGRKKMDNYREYSHSPRNLSLEQCSGHSRSPRESYYDGSSRSPSHSPRRWNIPKREVDSSKWSPKCEISPRGDDSPNRKSRDRPKTDCRDHCYDRHSATQSSDKRQSRSPSCNKEYKSSYQQQAVQSFDSASVEAYTTSQQSSNISTESIDATSSYMASQQNYYQPVYQSVNPHMTYSDYNTEPFFQTAPYNAPFQSNPVPYMNIPPTGNFSPVIQIVFQPKPPRASENITRSNLTVIPLQSEIQKPKENKPIFATTLEEERKKHKTSERTFVTISDSSQYENNQPPVIDVPENVTRSNLTVIPLQSEIQKPKENKPIFATMSEEKRKKHESSKHTFVTISDNSKYENKKPPVIDYLKFSYKELIDKMKKKKKHLLLLQNEMAKLCKMQSEMMWKKHKKKDGYKDALIIENTKLQEEVGNQIQESRQEFSQIIQALNKQYAEAEKKGEANLIAKHTV